jgi:hypothetical protein
VFVFGTILINGYLTLFEVSIFKNVGNPFLLLFCFVEFLSLYDGTPTRCVPPGPLTGTKAFGYQGRTIRLDLERDQQSLGTRKYEDIAAEQ